MIANRFRTIALGLGILALPASLIAQQKPSLTHAAYDIWNFISERHISPDGEWTAHVAGPKEKDATLHVVASGGATRYSIARGSGAKFTPSGRFLVAMIKAPRDSVKAAKKAKKKGDDMPGDSLAILDLSNGAIKRIPDVKSFQVPKDDGDYVAWLLTKDSSAKDDSSSDADKKLEKPEKDNQGKSDKKRKKAAGKTLVLRDLRSAEDSQFDHVLVYRFSNNGSWLALTKASKDSSADAVSVVETSDAAESMIAKGPGDFKHPVFDEQGEQLVFLSTAATFLEEQPSYTLNYWHPGAQAARQLAAAGVDGIADGWWVSEHRAPSFSENGERVFFGTAPRPEPEPDEEPDADEKVDVDIWSWTDPLLQPMQLKLVEQDRKTNYLATIAVNKGRVVQIGREDIPDVNLPNRGDGQIALGLSFLPYRKQISWDSPRYFDAYLIDMRTGEATLVLEAVQTRPRLSPEGKYVAWWDRDALAWNAMELKSRRRANISAAVPFPVHNELHDWPYKPNPYGSAGWIEGDRAFLVYDKYDIWQLDPKGNEPPRSLTRGAGRDSKTHLRYIRLDPEERAIARKGEILLSALTETTKQGGFFSVRTNSNAAPEQLLLTDHSYSRPIKSKNADRLLYTRESFREFPDIWISGMQFDSATKQSTSNPQQSDYAWGSASLTDWHSADGIPLQGLLFKPDGFDASKKYPMMVYFYEKSSNGLHRHRAPEPYRSIINITFYASRGYVVFVPDIPYKIGYPGESAMNAVVPGVLKVLAEGYVDRERIGVQGHSWGGYQIAYMVTRTNLFRAAEAGAPVANMTSAYGGIRWGSGMSRMFQYEMTQSRIGGSLWEYPLRYLENSPLFWADKIETPILMMHNDDDGAVPWYQGIEMFVALRRLEKPVWMINYNGEPHNLRKWQNKKDWALRMQQFFDHYLKDGPEPVWMREGVPALDKGRRLGTETQPEATDNELTKGRK